MATLEDVKLAIARARFVVIIGGPATGKSTLVSVAVGPAFTLFKSDDYMVHGFESALYVMMKDIARVKKGNVVVEGIQGYRLLRKLAELKKPGPDLIIECVAPRDVRFFRLQARGVANITKSLGMDGMLNSIYNDYKRIAKTIPTTLIYDTE